MPSRQINEFSQKKKQEKIELVARDLDVGSGSHCQYAYPHVSVVPVLGQKQFIHVVHGGGEVFGDKDVPLESRQLGKEAQEGALDVHVFGQGLVVSNGQNVLANLVVVFAQLDFQVSALHHRLPAQWDGAKPVEGQLGVDSVGEIS